MTENKVEKVKTFKETYPLEKRVHMREDALKKYIFYHEGTQKQL